MYLRSHPLTARLIVFVLLPLLACATWMWSNVRNSLPPEGAIQITEGVSAPVALSRDEHGVVHVSAGNDRDAFFAVGYAQAQDRLWQLELQRRMARGRLSEVLGKDSVDADVLFRTLGLYESARSAWPALSAPARASLTAYTAGINARLAHTAQLPAEFRILGVKPEPWTEIDSLAWIKVFALDLGGNYRREIDRYVAQSALTPEQAAIFFPEYPAQAPTTVASIEQAQGLLAMADSQYELQSKLRLAAPNTGSNAWAVAGRHTADGGALLANDPHLGLQIPSLWYAVSVDTPTLKVSGMSLIGLPVVVFGRNAQIAWGGTNMMADTQDLFFERADASGANYEADGVWQPFQVRSEVFNVRADFPEKLRRQYAPVTLQVRSSRHGPIISDHFKVFDQPVALRWTSLDAADTSYEAFFRMNYARDWSEFKQALSHHVAPAMNMLYADRAGNIGYLGAGRIPVRSRGEGTTPSPGWDSSYGWSGEVPPAQWPQTYNPPSGYLVSANNRVVGDDYPYFVSHDWASPARAQRIEQLLRQRIGSGRKLVAEDMQRIQADTVDLDAAAMMTHLRERLPQGEHGAQAAAYLRGWNGDMRADSQAASIFHVWMQHFRSTLFADQLQGTWNNPQRTRLLRRLGDGVRLERLGRLIQDDPTGWCDNRDTPRRETCEQSLASSQASALDELHKLRGDWSMRDWQWGQVQKTVYTHIPMSAMKPLNKVFERRIGNGGSSNSINVASSNFAYADGYLQDFGAGFRQVIALSPKQVTHWYMNSTGQSGNAMSPHYDDMVEPFRDVRYYRLRTAADGALPAPNTASMAAAGASR
ncbi:penicillin acylase family protein [Lysobacter sp. TAB13]|uniref:penicillin acylase family protein n=1 Tax=Lysobacter sp. TAB13 TaxID=3233065 RepID=UPI003F9DDBB4